MSDEKKLLPKFVVVICLLLGVAMIISGLLKTWFSTPIAFDWFIAGLGVAMCGFILFSKVSVTGKGVDMEFREDLKLLNKQLNK